MVSGGKRPCPECGDEIDTAEIICPWCGHAVPPPARDPFAFGASRITSHPRPAGRRVAFGVFLGNVAAFVQILFGQWVFRHSHGAGNAYITANFFFAPFTAGLVGSFYWRSIRPTAHGLAGYSLAVAFVILAVQVVTSVFVPGLLMMPFTIAGWLLVLFVPVLVTAFFIVWLGALTGNRLLRSPEL
jgi:hypothetical protein